MKLKEITIGGGGKISREYQSQEYPVSVTVIAEEGDKPSKIIEKAIKCLIVAREKAYEVAEEELERLILLKRESEMAEIKTAWDRAEKSTKAEPKNITASGHPVEKLVVTEEKTTTTEEVLMDLKNVTVMVITEKALLVSKEGLQKWIPKSTILGVFFRDYKEGKILLTDLEGLEDGNYLNEVELTEKGAWIAKKGWDKLEVRKR